MKLQHLTEQEDLKKKAQDYIKTIYKKGTRNPIGSGVVFGVGEGLVHLELSYFDGHVHITLLAVLEGLTGKGYGGVIMKFMTKEADKQDITLGLSAVPIEIAGKKIPKAKVVKFYKKYGFKKESGDQMKRLPQ